MTLVDLAIPACPRDTICLNSLSFTLLAKKRGGWGVIEKEKEREGEGKRREKGGG